MESNQVLGILLARDHAVVILAADQDGAVQIRQVMTVRPDTGGDAVGLSTAIGRELRSRSLHWDQASAALDSEFYSQYPMHSMFTDPRQIESTIKYDAEEVTAADAATLAVTFETLRSGGDGSNVIVYSADRQGLTDLLLDLQVDGMDPTFMEPDGVCLGRALDRLAGVSEHPETLYAVMGKRTCTLLRACSGNDAKRFRSFLINPAVAGADLLIAQLRLTLAAWSEDEPITKIEILGPIDQAGCRKIAETLNLSVELLKPQLQLPAVTGAAPSTDTSEILTAWGAALSLFSRGRKADFRHDFMPYQGRRKVLQSSLRMVGVSAAVILLAIGAYFQLKTFRMQRYAGRLEKKLAEEYKSCMFGQNPPAAEPIVSRLRREYIRVKKIQEGLGPGDEKSVTAKMTYVLGAFNNTPPEVQFLLDQLVINDRSMSIKGSTTRRQHTLALQNSIRDNPKLTIDNVQLIPAPGKDTFTMTLKMAEGN